MSGVYIQVFFVFLLLRFMKFHCIELLLSGYKVVREYEIKTTCGTKEEIPLDNKDLDCTIMQCRETDPPMPVDFVSISCSF